MNNFAGVLASIGLGAGTFSVTSQGIPPLIYRYNAGGGGYSASIVIELNQGVHFTLYQTSWDGIVAIPDATGGPINVGPNCLHLTAVGCDRWFFKILPHDKYEMITDHGTPSASAVKAFQTIHGDLKAHL